jgi:ThiF family
MSAAIDKNAQALRALFGNDALAARLASTRLAVVTPPSHLPAAGRLLGAALVEVLARLWPNVDLQGHQAEILLDAACAAAKSGGGATDGFKVQWQPPYDLVLCLGCEAQSTDAPVLRLGADGWVASLGSDATCGAGENPVGPALAAALGGAQVFRRIFSDELCEMDAPPIEAWHGDARALFGAEGLETDAIDLGSVAFFGVGAVTHGLMWLVERWPSAVHGHVSLVDQDRLGASNGQRYAGLRAEDVGHDKVKVMASRLQAAHPALAVESHPVDLNRYCASRGFEQPLERVVSGLDSAEARRQVALKLPLHTVNMWTAGERVGAGRYSPMAGGACLACEYLEKMDKPVDEVGELHQQTGLLPHVIRRLLDSGCGLTDSEAQTVAAKWQVPHAQFVGQPLRSVMPVLCATGRLQLDSGSETVDVPFAFASMLAGIAGFMMLLKDTQSAPPASEGWSQHIFKRPSYRELHRRSSRPTCVCCSAMACLAS